MNRYCAEHGIVPMTGCPICKAKSNAYKHAKQKAHGRTTYRWKKLRAAVLARDGRTCRDCGRIATSVHVDPRLHGRHDLATLNDCVSLCASCHGTRDAPRATRAF